MKKNRMRLKFCFGDIMAIVFVLALAVFVGVIFQKKTLDAGEMAVIYQDGKKIQELSLNKNVEIMIENCYNNKIAVKDGKVAIVESDCPGMDCVHSGWISRGGRSIVCLPNRVEIRIEGESEVDFIVR